MRPAAGWMTGLLIVWLVGAPMLFVVALSCSFRLPDTEAKDPVRGGWFLLACAVLLVVAPLAATLIGVAGRRRIYASVCAVLTLGGLVLGGLMTPVALDEIGVVRRPPPPAPTPTISQCVERSGGDTRCPGG
ncbi:hypothetical protein [Actinoplanes octamycinicus]|uniref:hypothetical protein n=1 Tax=Actinoplanes octamycinicus TaxID=135948 RepID=UPI0016108910|nr:hypothetical protein [Actinoplanes octamycinicus]